MRWENHRLDGATTRRKWWDFNYQPQLVIAGFHQQYGKWKSLTHQNQYSSDKQQIIRHRTSSGMILQVIWVVEGKKTRTMFLGLLVDFKKWWGIEMWKNWMARGCFPFQFCFVGSEKQKGLKLDREIRVWSCWRNWGFLQKKGSPSMFAPSCLKIALISNDHDVSRVSRFGRFKNRFPKPPPLNEKARYICKPEPKCSPIFFW